MADLSSLIQSAASKYGLDPALLTQVIQTESSGNPNAVSPKGAQGLMQLMPGTAAQYGASNPLDPAQNIDAGAHYLSDLLQQFNGDPSLALAAYNAGSGNVNKYGGIPPFPETQNYVTGILAKLGIGTEDGVTPDATDTTVADVTGLSDSSGLTTGSLVALGIAAAVGLLVFFGTE